MLHNKNTIVVTIKKEIDSVCLKFETRSYHILSFLSILSLFVISFESENILIA